MASKLAICAVNGDCVRWVEENGDQGEAVGTIAITKTEKIESLISEAAEQNDEEDFIRFSVELAALIWVQEGKDKKKQKPRTKKIPHFRFKGHAATNRFFTYLQNIEKFSGSKEPLPDWAKTALLERWRSPPGWRP